MDLGSFHVVVVQHDRVRSGQGLHQRWKHLLFPAQIRAMTNAQHAEIVQELKQINVQLESLLALLSATSRSLPSVLGPPTMLEKIFDVLVKISTELKWKS